MRLPIHCVWSGTILGYLVSICCLARTSKVPVLTGLPPSRGTTHQSEPVIECGKLYRSLPKNKRYLPSGDQMGQPADTNPDRSFRGDPPDVSFTNNEPLIACAPRGFPNTSPVQ